ncbi:unnamed protein product, partial [Prorocentrum cordatum]
MAGPSSLSWPSSSSLSSSSLSNPGSSKPSDTERLSVGPRPEPVVQIAVGAGAGQRSAAQGGLAAHGAAAARAAAGAGVGEQDPTKLPKAAHVAATVTMALLSAQPKPRASTAWPPRGAHGGGCMAAQCGPVRGALARACARVRRVSAP